MFNSNRLLTRAVPYRSLLQTGFRNDFVIVSRVAFGAGTATGVVGFAAENRATVKLAHSVVATETAFAIALVGRSVRGDFQRRR